MSYRPTYPLDWTYWWKSLSPNPVSVIPMEDNVAACFSCLRQSIYLQICDEGAQCRSPNSSRWRSKVAIVLVICIIITIVCLAVVQHKKKTPSKYGVVADAGSSHTGIYVYQWLADKENGTGMVQQVMECTAEDPLTEFERNPNSTLHCLKVAVKSVPSIKRAETTISLGATAGMRLLSLKNESMANHIIQLIHKTLSTTVFDMRDVSILDGADEGAFGWITVNYLTGKLVELNTWTNSFTLPEGMDTFGALDLGGASTQISYVPLERSTNDTLVFHLYGRNYNVYTHSYLCFGQNQALLKLLANLSEEITGDGLDVPCFQKGYAFNMTGSKLFGSPCTQQHNTDTKEHNRTISLVGLGDPGACSSSIANLFNTLDFHQESQPPFTCNFMAFSAFYYTMSFFNLSEGSSSPEQLNETVWTFCALPWHEVKARWSVPEKYLSNYCFAGFYVLHLLTLGYRFNKSTWSNIKFVNKLEGTLGKGRAGWTLGYMLNLTNLLPEEAPVNPIHLVPFAVVISLLVLGLFVLIVLLLFKSEICFPSRNF
uniref:ectonucleoside triphosphate diphosphohydrolase 1-like isoform X2 n=2 Tax=Myxine glutinosa TaxID=7769 RepID=UPI00358E159B